MHNTTDKARPRRPYASPVVRVLAAAAMTN